ncbi:hypothetical protein [Streptomyces olivaceus]|nr:hypothetical protein [Streptomyces olivaceus]
MSCDSTKECEIAELSNAQDNGYDEVRCDGSGGHTSRQSDVGKGAFSI